MIGSMLKHSKSSQCVITCCEIDRFISWRASGIPQHFGPLPRMVGDRPCFYPCDGSFE